MSIWYHYRNGIDSSEFSYQQKVPWGPAERLVNKNFSCAYSLRRRQKENYHDILT